MRALVWLVFLLMVHTPTGGAPPRIVVLELDDTIQPASVRYLERGLDEAREQGAALVVVEVDSPGGLVDSMRAMTSAILASPVPVAVYVTPSGARAASAGFFLLLASDVAAMTPGTNTGAAHPVTIGGGQGEDDGGPALDKAAEDIAALARSLAQGRGRSVEAAEQAIFESKSFSAEEARDRELIEVIAADRSELLAALDGRTVTRFDGSTQTLQLRGAEVVTIEHTFAERVLSVIASPQVAYLLMTLGAMGLLFELMSPGLLVPGIAGGLALLLGLYGFSVLPVDVVGVLLIVAGLGLLVAEVFVTAYGVLALAGLAAFVVGSLMLVDSPLPAFDIGPAVVIPVAILLAIVTAVLAHRAVRSRRVRSQTGIDAMIGETGTVVAEIEPDHAGKVFVHGEYWSATADERLPPGTSVRVDAVEALLLRVSPAPTEGATA